MNVIILLHSLVSLIVYNAEKEKQIIYKENHVDAQRSYF